MVSSYVGVLIPEDVTPVPTLGLSDAAGSIAPKVLTPSFVFLISRAFFFLVDIFCFSVASSSILSCVGISGGGAGALTGGAGFILGGAGGGFGGLKHMVYLSSLITFFIYSTTLA
jgi:hypothetical protein